MDNNDKIFFVFTCVKDGRNYINRLFESLLQQTKKNFIHYIYEDGSNDPLNEMVDDYIQKVNLLASPYTVIYENCKSNIGLNKATEHCLKKCNLKYYMWINCDDWLDSDFFEEAGKFVKKHPNYAIYRSKMVFHKGVTETVVPNTKKEIKMFKRKHQLYPYLSNLYKFNHFIGNFKLLQEVNPNLFLIDCKTFFSDAQVCLPFIFEKYKFGYISKTKSHYLYRENSEFNSNSALNNTNFEPYLDYSFTNYYSIYQTSFKYSRLFGMYTQKKDYKRAIYLLRERKKYLRKIGFSNRKVLIFDHSPNTWLIYCYIKLIFYRLKCIIF